MRGVVNNMADVLESRLYQPYGGAFGGSMTTDPNYDSPVYGFTGEPTDDNDLLYLRARYYNPNLGVFTSLDPFEGMADRPMSLNGYSWVEGNAPNATDPSGMQQSSTDCMRGDPISLSNSRCDYARKLLALYPESKSIAYWLRFSLEGLTDAYNRHQTGDSLSGERLAVVPLDFVHVTGGVARADENGRYQQLAVAAFRNLEASLDRPPTFVEILAVIITGEVSPILEGVNVPAKSDGCGRTTAEFQALTREAVQRFFHGQCRRDGAFGDLPANNASGSSLTGQCGPGRLIGALLANVQGFYDEIYVGKGYEKWLELAKELIAGVQPGGYGCEGQTRGTNGTANAPFIWGNGPSALFPQDPPVVGAGRVIDWIGGQPGKYKYVLIQSSSNCPTSGNRCGNKDTSKLPNQPTC